MVLHVMNSINEFLAAQIHASLKLLLLEFAENIFMQWPAHRYIDFM